MLCLVPHALLGLISRNFLLKRSSISLDLRTRTNLASSYFQSFRFVRIVASRDLACRVPRWRRCGLVSNRITQLQAPEFAKAIWISERELSYARELAAHLLVDAGCACPIEHIYQFPGILSKFNFKLTFLVNGKLARRIQYARALFLVTVVYVELSAGKIKGC
jgi:hypothetical protein